ncbi:MAG: hypothetical protein V1749_02935 [Candidatus Desantisbacteria bacterium]
MKKYKKTEQEQGHKIHFWTQADKRLMCGCLLLMLIGIPLIIDPRLSNIELGKAVWMWVLTCGCLLIWSIKMGMSGKITVLKTPINIPLLAFLFSCILSTCFSILPHMSIIGEYKRNEGLLTLINYVALCYICVNLVRDIA